MQTQTHIVKIDSKERKAIAELIARIVLNSLKITKDETIRAPR